MDDLEKVDIGDGVIPQPTYGSAHLNTSQKIGNNQVVEGIQVLFCLGYIEMPRLSRELIEYRQPIKAGFRPYKQGARNFKLEIVGRLKEEVDWLLQAEFIQPCRYADWVSNIIPVEKRNMGKIRILWTLETSTEPL
jgi:hypothetical protein